MPSFYEIEALGVEALGNMTIYMNRIGNMDQISGVLKSLEWLRNDQLVKYHQLFQIKSVLDSSVPPGVAAMFSHVSTSYHMRQTG